MSILLELNPVEYEGIQYPSIMHAYLANTTGYGDIKWYLINSTHERAAEIIKYNFSFCMSNDEVEKTSVMNRILSVKDKDPVFYDRIRSITDTDEKEKEKEIMLYLESIKGETDVFN